MSTPIGKYDESIRIVGQELYVGEQSKVQSGGQAKTHVRDQVGEGVDREGRVDQAAVETLSQLESATEDRIIGSSVGHGEKTRDEFSLQFEEERPSISVLPKSGRQGDQTFEAEGAVDFPGNDQNASSQMSTLLLKAVQEGNAYSVKTLIQSRVDIKAFNTNPEARAALWGAIKNGNIEIVTMLRRAGVNFTIIDAITKGANKEIVEALFSIEEESGANMEKIMNARDRSGKTAMTHAAMKGRMDIVKLLIQEGADPTRVDNEGNSVLMWAFLTGNENQFIENLASMDGGQAMIDELMKWDGSKIIEKAIDFDRLTGLPKQFNDWLPDENGMTPLWHAVEDEDVDKIKLLLDKGVVVNARPVSGDTILMYAIWKKVKSETIELVLSRLEGVDLDAILNARDPLGQTALLWAARGGSDNLAKLLTQKGADLLIKDNNGDTALVGAHLRISESTRCELIDALPKEGREEELTQLCIDAIRNNQLALLDKLITTQPQLIERPDQNGLTLLMHAASQGNVDAVNALIKKEAKIEVGDKRNCTALTYAVASGQIPVVRVLKGHGANIDPFDIDGRTPLLDEIAQYGIGEHGERTKMASVLELLGADKNYAEIGRDRILLAHKLGMGGFTTVKHQQGDHKLKIEGCNRSDALRTLSEDLESFFKTHQQNSSLLLKEGPWLSGDDQLEIQECVKNAYPLVTEINEATVERIRSGKPFVILGGSTGDQAHAVCIVLCKNELMICNRGLEKKENVAVVRYALPSEKVTLTMLNALINFEPSMEKFNKKIDGIIEDNDLKFKGGYYQQAQKVGNCALAASKGGLGCLFRAYADVNWGNQSKEDLEHFENIKLGNDFYYKPFTEQMRKKAVVEYDKKYPVGSEGFDSEFRDKIKKKQDAKKELKAVKEIVNKNIESVKGTEKQSDASSDIINTKNKD